MLPKAQLEKRKIAEEGIVAAKRVILQQETRLVGNYVHDTVPASDDEGNNEIIRAWTPGGIDLGHNGRKARGTPHVLPGRLRHVPIRNLLDKQVLCIVSGAVNNAAAKKYDLEAYLPFQAEYKELTRELEIRYGANKGETVVGGRGKKENVHALNALSLLFTCICDLGLLFRHYARLTELYALLENY
ncbi:Cytosolic seryl-tRNA synthetase [Xylographa soralifera]|nr:Cytosolic seryl-tRNA synthetase [Xylographa soralifera]